jgi:hypothetical protein
MHIGDVNLKRVDKFKYLAVLLNYSNNLFLLQKNSLLIKVEKQHLHLLKTPEIYV